MLFKDKIEIKKEKKARFWVFHLFQWKKRGSTSWQQIFSNKGKKY